MKILVAEDDMNIRKGLVRLLEAEGYGVTAASDGSRVMPLLERDRPDLVCLDVMMPGRDGYDLCREIRAAHPGLPVIFISAKSEEIDKVLGLELGADDYIVKPFGVREVVARIRAVTRRYLAGAVPRPSDPPDEFRMGDLTVRRREMRARRGETSVDLSLRDVAILALLFTRKGQTVSREDLFRECWGVDHIPNSRTLDQHISQLRKKIETDPKRPAVILTVHGIGYRHDG